MRKQSQKSVKCTERKVREMKLQNLVISGPLIVSNDVTDIIDCTFRTELTMNAKDNIEKGKGGSNVVHRKVRERRARRSMHNREGT